MISQYVDYESELVYFYPDENFLIYEIGKEVSDDKIKELKIKNDWNKEIDFKKCIKRQFDEYKEINEEKEISLIFDNLYIGIDVVYEKIILCDIDEKNYKLYAVRIDGNGDEYKVFAIMIKNDNYTDYDIIEIKDWYYIDVIKNFKKSNNWDNR